MDSFDWGLLAGLVVGSMIGGTAATVLSLYEIRIIRRQLEAIERLYHRIQEGKQPMISADSHVHTQFSGDAVNGSMETSCREAIDLGVPAIAFTDHADFTDEAEARNGFKGHRDVLGYLVEIERCRAAFPDLTILSGVELGEPHWFPEQAEAIRTSGRLDRVLASVHCVKVDGIAYNSGTPGVLAADNVDDLMRQYLRETLALVESSQRFDVLAHIDYPARYWPGGTDYRESEFEQEFRAILAAAAERGLTLEVNTSRGRRLCPGQQVLLWWIEEGGRLVSIGSDSHSPDTIGAGFDLAEMRLRTLGLQPPADALGFWRIQR